MIPAVLFWVGAALLALELVNFILVSFQDGYLDLEQLSPTTIFLALTLFIASAVAKFIGL